MQNKMKLIEATKTGNIEIYSIKYLWLNRLSSNLYLIMISHLYEQLGLSIFYFT